MSVNEIQIEMEFAKKLVAKQKKLEVLIQNPDFKELILEGYLKEEAVRLVHLKADPMHNTKEAQDTIDLQISGIGCLHQYFQVVQIHAQMAQKAISEGQDAISEELAEE